MCGLVGIYSSNMLAKHKDVLEALLYLDTWRGKDSTGVAAIRHNTDTDILKSTVPGYEFIDGPRLSSFLRFTDFCWIGHNRFGTVGKVTRSNAHPFSILDKDGGSILVGAHNGTLSNKHVLEDHALFGTDSEAMFYNIALRGLEETISSLTGAWAITYYDHVQEELRFLRNDQRPLHYAYSEDKKTLYWASESWMIRIAVDRAGLKLFEDKVYKTEENVLYRFPVPIKSNDVLTMEKKEGVTGKVQDFFQGEDYWHGQRQHWHTPSRPQPQAAQKMVAQKEVTSQSTTTNATNGGTQSQTKSHSSDSQSAASDNVTNIDEAKKYKGFNGISKSKAEIEADFATGCGWCQAEFCSITEPHAWIAPEISVCHKCLTDTHVQPEAKTVTVH